MRGIKSAITQARRRRDDAIYVQTPTLEHA